MRWVVTLGLSFVYMIRVYLLQVGVAEPSAERLHLNLSALWVGMLVFHSLSGLGGFAVKEMVSSHFLVKQQT